MLRFAPSPTEDLHVDSLRIALFNYILSIQKKEDLIIRIEDSDTARNIEGKDKEIIGLLDLFGIHYKDVVYQSAYLKYHRAMALQLIHEKIAFNCFCTPETLKTKGDQAKKENKPYRYDDTCLLLTPDETIDNEAPFTVRLRKPNVDVEFTDLFRGKMSFSPEDIDSFVILNADKSPTYNFACAVDDMISDISAVVRSEDHLSDTPKQIVVRAALNYTKEIEFIHLPQLVNKEGERVNYEDNASSVKWLLEEGILPQSIINYLIAISCETTKELFSLEEAISWLDLTKLSQTPAVFEMDALRDMNRKHLESLEDVELSRYVGFADGDIGKLAKLYLDEVSTTKELKQKVGSVFAGKNIPAEFTQSVAKIKEVLHSAPFFDKFDAFNAYVMKESGLEGDNYFKALRLLLCGEENGPDLAKIYPLIKNYMMEIVK